MNRRTHYFDNPRNVKGFLWIVFLISAGLFLLDLVVHRHVTHPWESIPGFYAFFGFVACGLLVLLAKRLRTLVMRDESYYEHE